MVSQGLGFKSFLHLLGTGSWAILSTAIRASFLIGKMGILISAPGERIHEIVWQVHDTVPGAWQALSARLPRLPSTPFCLCFHRQPAGLPGGGP